MKSASATTKMVYRRKYADMPALASLRYEYNHIFVKRENFYFGGAAKRDISKMHIRSRPALRAPTLSL